MGEDNYTPEDDAPAYVSAPSVFRAGPIDASHATADLFAALAKAQEQARTVGKEGRNTQGRYLYATADDMIAAGRKARAGTGLSLVTTWSTEPPPEPRKGQDYGNQWIHATVRIDWLLAHSSGGYLSGTAYVDAIASRGRPPDKAIAAALTYGEGFVERGLLRLDRDEDPEDVDQRTEDEAPRQQAPAKQRPKAQTLGETQTAEELHAWCAAYGAKVARLGESKIGDVVAHGEAIGVGAKDVRGWLGLGDEDEEAA